MSTDKSSGSAITQQAKDHYDYIILHKITSFFYYFSSTTSDNQLVSSPKRILIVDDDPDITLAFKVGLEDHGSFNVYTYTDPLEALSNFKPYFYDLLLLDVNMPNMNGFELCKRILEIDVNVRICFITAGDTNIEALREIYPTLNIGCFIKKPVTIEYLARKLLAELD
jgi:DNA-binding response OmpR family regulator